MQYTYTVDPQNSRKETVPEMKQESCIWTTNLI